MQHLSPVQPENRAGVLDALRGFALLGIILANSGYFSMYIFQSPAARQSMPMSAVDKGLEYFHLAFIDGKFYSVFSMLFGIGFYIFLFGKSEAPNRLGLFYRRLFILLILGVAHSLLIWDGDILVFYALVGMVLPLFRNLAPKKLLWLALLMVLSPLAFDALKVLTNNSWNISNPMMALTLNHDRGSGITEQNVSHWILDHTSYRDLLNWNQSGVLWGWTLRLDGNRIFKVLGMFLIGLAIGKLKLFNRIEEFRPMLRRLMYTLFAVGIIGGVLKIAFYDKVNLPAAGGLLDTLAYSLNVAPMALAYSIGFALLYERKPVLKWLEPVGRMALTNYIVQSVICIMIYYGIGFGLATRVGPSTFLPIAIAVYAIQVLYSKLWFEYFAFGPLEWIWRQLTYGKPMKIVK